MTFEDFFIKKRIDLLQLQEAEPLLYKEFKSHFELMGEKSFDHTKKFWFNRLRKSFHLKEEINVSKPVITASPLDENKAIARSEAPQAVKPTGFTPRFKATKVQESEKEEKADQVPQVNAESNSQKPIGFKPRFKAGAIKTDPTLSTDKTTPNEEIKKNVDESDAAGSKIDQNSSETKSLGFKPRFKAGLTNKKAADEPKTEEEIVKEKSATEQTSSEPLTTKGKDTAAQATQKTLGFKPRFKAGTTKTDSTQSTDKSTPTEEIKKTTDEPDAADSKIDQNSSETKSLGFKPRFKAGLTNKKVTDEPKMEEEIVKEKAETEQPSSEPLTTKGEDIAAQATQKPLGFKPRFKPKQKEE